MGIRETLNRNPAITTGATIVLIIGALAWIYFSMSSSGHHPLKVPQAYFTTDDGETTFPDKATRIVPFEKDGKEAVQAHMFSCDNGKTKFVGFLEKLSDSAMKRLDKARSGSGEVDDVLLREIQNVSMVVKKPKDPEAKWVARDTTAGEQVRRIACPHGDASHQLMEVYEK